MIEELWARFRPLAVERVTTIEAYLDGRSSRAEALDAAHNLSGALGSYGRPDGSAAAREIEGLLASGDERRADVTAVMDRLRASL